MATEELICGRVHSTMLQLLAIRCDDVVWRRSHAFYARRCRICPDCLRRCQLYGDGRNYRRTRRRQRTRRILHRKLLTRLANRLNRRRRRKRRSAKRKNRPNVYDQFPSSPHDVSYLSSEGSVFGNKRCGLKIGHLATMGRCSFKKSLVVEKLVLFGHFYRGSRGRA